MHSAQQLTDLLNVRHPVIQGPFGGNLSTVELASTVSNLGGLGSFGAHVLAPEDIGPVTGKLRAATSQPFALNLWSSDHDPGGVDLSAADFQRHAKAFEPVFQELGLALPSQPVQFSPRFSDQIDALIEARPPVFSFVFGIPETAVLQACRTRGIVTLGTATTVAEAQALEAAGVDAVIATGFEAGGHRVSFLASAEESLTGTFALTQLVAARIRIPVIAAGGIANRPGMQAALMLGAQAVQVGTAFLACRESGTTAEHRALLFNTPPGNTVLTRAFSGRLARGIRNRWTEQLAPLLPAIAPFPVQSWFMGQLRKEAIRIGRTDVVSLWCGQIAPLLRHHTARDLFNSFINDQEIA
jgi:nitronate monooxygenase